MNLLDRSLKINMISCRIIRKFWNFKENVLKDIIFFLWNIWYVDISLIIKEIENVMVI